MSLTASAGLPIAAADIGIVSGTLNLGTYATGGVSISGAQVKCPTNLLVLDVAHSGGYVFEYVPTGATGGVVKAYATGSGSGSALSEVANSTNLGSANPRFVAFGY